MAMCTDTNERRALDAGDVDTTVETIEVQGFDLSNGIDRHIIVDLDVTLDWDRYPDDIDVSLVEYVDSEKQLPDLTDEEIEFIIDDVLDRLFDGDDEKHEELRKILAQN